MKKTTLFVRKCVLVLFMTSLIFVGFVCAEDIITEENGVITIIGNPTPEEKAENLNRYKERMAKREARIEREIQRAHELKIEQIRARIRYIYRIIKCHCLRHHSFFICRCNCH